MRHTCADPTRRRFMIRVVATSLAVPAAAALPARHAWAQEMPPVDESDPTAKALKYVHDATKASGRKDPTHICANCKLYVGAEGSEWGGCNLFPSKSVAAKGWCSAWLTMG